MVVATTDAMIPQKLSDEMNVTDYLRKGQRVRTVKLRGVYSECLIIPLAFAPVKGKSGDYFEGKDMMELMGISKWEPPAVQVQLASGRKIRYHQNPNFHVYYKFPNSKNVPDIFSNGDDVQITRKIHGTNARYGIVKKAKLSLWDKIKKFIGAATFVIPALFAMLCVKSVDLNYEDKMLEDAANWLDFNQPQAKHVYSHHVVFSYFYDQLQKDKKIGRAHV